MDLPGIFEGENAPPLPRIRRLCDETADLLEEAAAVCLQALIELIMPGGARALNSRGVWARL
jgi:hypothetical protein